MPPFYCYHACDVKRIQEALENGCGYDAPGSFAAWLSKQTPMDLKTLLLNPDSSMAQYVLDKHYMRKHGPNAYYGQK